MREKTREEAHSAWRNAFSPEQIVNKFFGALGNMRVKRVVQEVCNNKSRVFFSLPSDVERLRATLGEIEVDGGRRKIEFERWRNENTFGLSRRRKTRQHEFLRLSRFVETISGLVGEQGYECISRVQLTRRHMACPLGCILFFLAPRESVRAQKDAARSSSILTKREREKGLLIRRRGKD